MQRPVKVSINLAAGVIIFFSLGKIKKKEREKVPRIVICQCFYSSNIWNKVVIKLCLHEH